MSDFLARQFTNFDFGCVSVRTKASQPLERERTAPNPAWRRVSPPSACLWAASADEGFITVMREADGSAASLWRSDDAPAGALPSAIAEDAPPPDVHNAATNTEEEVPASHAHVVRSLIHQVLAAPREAPCPRARPRPNVLATAALGRATATVAACGAGH